MRLDDRRANHYVAEAYARCQRVNFHRLQFSVTILGYIDIFTHGINSTLGPKWNTLNTVCLMGAYVRTTKKCQCNSLAFVFVTKPTDNAAMHNEQ